MLALSFFWCFSPPIFHCLCASFLYVQCFPLCLSLHFPFLFLLSLSLALSLCLSEEGATFEDRQPCFSNGDRNNQKNLSREEMVHHLYVGLLLSLSDLEGCSHVTQLKRQLL